MIDTLLNIIEQNKEARKQFHDLFIEQEIAAKTILLREGDVSFPNFRTNQN